MLRFGWSWSLFAIVLALAVLTGYTAGLHHRISAHDWGRALFAIGSAITANVYGLRGSVYFEPVTDALQEAGLTGNLEKLRRLGSSFPGNLLDGALINKAIQHASHLQLRIPEPAQQTEKFNVRGLGSDDPGYAEFVRLSFTIFSPSIESLSLSYLSLFIISATLFIIAMRGAPFYVGVLTLLAAVHCLLFKSHLFKTVSGSPLFYFDPTISFGAPSAAHFITVLATLPLLHLLALVCRKVPITFGQAFCLAGQGLIAGFVIYARSSALWILLAAAFIPMAATSLWGKREPPVNVESPLGGASFFRTAGCTSSQYWAAILFLVVAAAVYVGLQATLHPLYKSGGSLGRHAFWTEVFYGLQQHPDWLHKYSQSYKLNGHVAVGDDLPMAAALNYLERHPPSVDQMHQVYDEGGGVRWRAINDYVFSALLELGRSDPLFVLQSFLYKVRGSFYTISDCLIEVFANRSIFDYPLLIFILFGVAMTSSGFGQPLQPDGWKYLVMTFIAVALSVTPNVVTICDWQYMADSIYLTSFALLLLMTFVLTALVRRLKFSFSRSQLPLGRCAG
jgi:hypothetical protein